MLTPLLLPRFAARTIDRPKGIVRPGDSRVREWAAPLRTTPFAVMRPVDNGSRCVSPTFLFRGDSREDGCSRWKTRDANSDGGKLDSQKFDPSERRRRRRSEKTERKSDTIRRGKWSIARYCQLMISKNCHTPCVIQHLTIAVSRGLLSRDDVFVARKNTGERASEGEVAPFSRVHFPE